MGSGGFDSTRWSVVLTAGRSAGPEAGDALAWLCKTYWRPLFAYVRRRGYSKEEAEDLTQEFFCRQLERRSLAAASPERGRFRSFLLASRKHFLANEWHRDRALKRGGGTPVLSLDIGEDDGSRSPRAVDDLTPEKVYERTWALTLLDRALARVREHYEATGKRELYTTLKFVLSSDQPSRPYSDLARELGITEGHVKTAVHRLRRRYRSVLRDEIAETVSSPEAVDDEIRHLLAVVAGDS